MTHMKLKFSVAGGVLIAAVAYLAIAGMKSGWVYTLPVDQYVQNPEQQRQRVRLCGTVSENEMEVHRAQLWAKFSLKGDKTQVPVCFKGVVPDMFKAGSDVVVEGQPDPAGVFQADVLMTKCASKYEERPQGHPAVAAGNPTGGQP